MGSRLGRPKRIGARAFLWLLNVALMCRHPATARRFVKKIRRVPNFAAPASFTEKIHWRKIFDDDPRFAILLDKLKAKAFVRERLAWLGFPEVLWQGDNPRDIPFGQLKIPYMVKCNHGCDMNAAVPDPATVDSEQIIAEMSRHRAKTFGVDKLEPAYAHIKPRVFVETLIGKDQGYLPIDYKFSVIGGRVTYIIVTASRSTVRKTGLFDRHWQRLPAAQRGIDPTLEIDPPASFARMIEAAETLGREFDMMRVDFYEDAGQPVFGEFTVYPRSGLLQFDPPFFDYELGARWDIAASAYLTCPPSRFARLYKAMLIAAGYIGA
ncbi:MAG: ATP-grasp fold amidoligase family protein [Mesorhizobium sp.]